TALPAVAAELAPIGGSVTVYRLLAGLPDSGAMQAAWTIRVKFEETFALMPLTALAMAVAVVVGQNIGAKEFPRAKRCAIFGTLSALLVMAVLGLVVNIYSNSLVAWFSHDPLTSNLGSALLLPCTIVMPAMAISQVLFGALDGAGLTKLPMIINIVGLVL